MKQNYVSKPAVPGSRDGQVAAPVLRITAPPGPVLVDDSRGVVISGCEPGSPVVVRARVSMDHATREATATFHASDAGTVDTGRDASVAGTYAGVDPFGLWWSGDLIAPSTTAIPSPVGATMYAQAGGRTTRSAIERRWLAPGATVEDVREPGVWGMLARPAGPGPFPSVIAFAGSSGGLGAAAAWAPVLASHGIAALAIAYFGVPGLPQELARIDIEVVERAAEWLLRRPDVADGKIAVMGISRGSELALLAGALLEPIGPVVAFAPSGVCWAGLGPRGPLDAPAWRFRGDDIPCAGMRSGGLPNPPATAPGSAIALRPYFEAFLGEPATIQAAEIRVEEVKGPILMVSGEADEMWPSADLAQIAERRAAERGFRHQLTHLRYPAAGHLCGGVPGTPVASEVRHPLTGQVYSLGGTPAANARARADSWPRVVQCVLEGSAAR